MKCENSRKMTSSFVLWCAESSIWNNSKPMSIILKTDSVKAFQPNKREQIKAWNISFIINTELCMHCDSRELSILTYLKFDLLLLNT